MPDTADRNRCSAYCGRRYGTPTRFEMTCVGWWSKRWAAPAMSSGHGPPRALQTPPHRRIPDV